MNHQLHSASTASGVLPTGDEYYEPPEPPLEFSDMPHEGSPPTPNKVRPDVVFERDFFSDDIEMPDGRKVNFWSFEDERGNRTWPAPTMRLRQGQVAHTIVKASKNT